LSCGQKKATEERCFDRARLKNECSPQLLG
jgi:hypothetical protein